jgi:ABC-type glycerol-3-phosphate transport system permease component
MTLADHGSDNKAIKVLLFYIASVYIYPIYSIYIDSLRDIEADVAKSVG